MSVRVALFRGINVGGKNRLPMKELVAILEGLGCHGVRTYIQSGNAVFAGPDGDDATLAARITEEIARRQGFSPQVLLLGPEDLEQAIAGNPFPEGGDDPAHLHLGFLSGPPNRPDLEKLDSLRSGSERFHLSARVFYLYAPDGVGNSKLAGSVERVLGVPMTDRNWTTVLALRELAVRTAPN